MLEVNKLLGIDTVLKRQKEQEEEIEKLKLAISSLEKGQNDAEKFRDKIAETVKRLEKFEDETLKETKEIKTALEKQSTQLSSSPSQRQIDSIRASMDNLESKITLVKNDLGDIKRLYGSDNTPAKLDKISEAVGALSKKMEMVDVPFKAMQEEFARLKEKSEILNELEVLTERGYKVVAVCPNCQNKTYPKQYLGKICPRCRYGRIAKGVLIAGLRTGRDRRPAAPPERKEEQARQAENPAGQS